MIYDLTICIYRSIALISLIVAAAYLHLQISMFWGTPIEYFALASTFSLDKVLVALALVLNIGAFCETYVEKIADYASILFTLFLLGDFLFNPLHEILPRGYALWLFYILIGISCSYIMFISIEQLESSIEEWSSTDFRSPKSSCGRTFKYKHFEEIESQRLVSMKNEAKIALPQNLEGKVDPLFMDIAYDVIESKSVSLFSIQRKYKVGFNRAGRIADQLQEAGVIGKQNNTITILMSNVDELEKIKL